MKVSTAAELSGQISKQADVIVIGSGACGAVMAYELAKTGKRVLILEAGPYVPSSEFNERITGTLERLYADGGSQANSDGDLTVLQGRCVGGSTVVNATVSFRIPDWVLNKWAEEHGIRGMSPEEMRPIYERVEKNLWVHENAGHEINRNSQLMQRGAEKLGLSVKPLSRNIKHCALTGYCISGCRYDRKQSMLVTYLPWAVKYGAEIIADCEVEQIVATGGRVTGVKATVRNAQGETVAQIDAKADLVVLAAGAVQSPLLLLKSGLANGSDQVGRNFACHPSMGIPALFDEQVNMWDGALLGVYMDEFDHPDKGGFILEGGGGEPAMFTPLVPGDAAGQAERIKQFDHVANMVELIHDENVGRISLKDGHKVIEYRLSEDDKPRLRKALKTAAEIWFAAGAKEVWLPTASPTVLHNASEIASIDDMPMNRSDLIMNSYHPQGTCRMGADPAASVVNSYGQTHEIPNLVIADASVFPTSVLVNTQTPVYGLATRIAEYVNAEPSRYGI